MLTPESLISAVSEESVFPTVVRPCFTWSVENDPIQRQLGTVETLDRWRLTDKTFRHERIFIEIDEMRHLYEYAS